MSENNTTSEATKKEEYILALPTAAVNTYTSAGIPVETAMQFLLSVPGASGMLPRSEVEDNEAYIQLVSYVVLQSQQSIFVYRRGRSGSEDRLHDQYSIGVGGHVNIVDSNAICNLYMRIVETGESPALHSADILYMAARRELDEEISGIEGTEPFLYVTAFYDQSSHVSARHLAALWVADVDAAKLSAAEQCLEDGQWVDVSELQSEEWQEKLESWSKIALQLIPENPDKTVAVVPENSNYSN